MSSKPHARDKLTSAKANRAKDLRLELGLTRVELARLADLSEKTLDRVERGAQSFRETTYRKIFNALNKARTKEGLPALVYQDLFKTEGTRGV